jgi:hypothetical protein
MSLSSAIVDKSVAFSSVIVGHKYDFNNFNLQKLCSANAIAIGMVNRTLYIQLLHWESNHVASGTFKFQ